MAIQMGPSWWLKIAILVFCSRACAWVIPKDYGDAGMERHLITPVLSGRQSSGCDANLDTEAPICRPLCAPRNSACLSTRALDFGSRFTSLSRNLSNAETHEEVDPSFPELLKRTLDPLTQGDVVDYVAKQFDPKNNLWGPTRLAHQEDGEDDDSTVVVQREFGDESFALGTPGLHGCTVVTVISNRAVFMGHFWEEPSWWGEDNVEQFKLRVLNWFSGAGIPVGFGGPNGEAAEALNVELFSGGDTRAYIMHPRNEKVDDAFTPEYPKKSEELHAAIRNRLGDDVHIVTYHYVAAQGVDDEEYLENRKGVAVFQFDPKARGRLRSGRPGWRLFYDHRLFQDTDPPPLASEWGVPDI